MLPHPSRIQQVSHNVAVKVAMTAQRDGLARQPLGEDTATVSGALRLSLRSDGLLLGEACEDSQERLQQILQELADTGAASFSWLRLL